MRILMNREQKLKNLKSNKGFTLVELIVVIVIISILVGLTVLGVTKWVGTARRNQDLNNAKAIENLLNAQFISGDYWNSPEFWTEMRRCGWVFGNSKEYLDINDGNSVYIMMWDEYPFNQFQTNPSYASFPTTYYRAINCEENRAWYMWRWLSYNSTEAGCSTQQVLNEIPLAQQPGYCFYFLFYFDEYHFAKRMEVICAPNDKILGAYESSPDSYYALQEYKVNYE